MGDDAWNAAGDVGEQHLPPRLLDTPIPPGAPPGRIACQVRLGQVLHL